MLTIIILKTKNMLIVRKRQRFIFIKDKAVKLLKSTTAKMEFLDTE